MKLLHKLHSIIPSDLPSTARVSPCHTPQQCDCGGRVGRGPQRDCIVVCSYLLINPQWSMSSPGPLFSLHSTAPSDKVAGRPVGRSVGWLVAGLGGFVCIRRTEKGQPADTLVLHHHHSPAMTRCNNKEKKPHRCRCQPLLSCFKLYSVRTLWDGGL